MKKFLAVIFSAIVLAISAFTIVGCGCSDDDISQEPATDIVGNWGGRSDDVEAEFNDDGTCTIGGVVGTYEIDENNTLTVTPASDGETESDSLVFEFYNDNDTSRIQQNQWTVNDGTLYINGYQYSSTSTDSSKTNNENNSVDNQSSSAESDNSASSGVASNKPADNSSSSNTSSSTSSSGTSNSSNSSSSSSSSNSSNSSNSSSSSSSSDNSSSSSGTSSEVLQEGDEEQVVNILENIDDF